MLLVSLSVAACFHLPSWAEALNSSPTTDWRARLPELQLSTRQMANLHNLIKRSQMEKFHSGSLETGSDTLLQAYCLYEEAVQNMLESKEPEALQKIDRAITLIAAMPDEDKPALRRLVLAKEALTEPALLGEFLPRITAIAGTVQKHSIPSTEVLLESQYRVEQWFTSAEMILRAWTALESAPRQPGILAEIVKKTGAEICADKKLMSTLTADADSSVAQHEVLLDQLVFKKREEALFEKIFSCLTQKVKTLPNALQPAAFALFTLWCGQSPGEAAAVPMDAKLLSPEEMADYFACLDSLLSVAQTTGLEEVRAKMAQSITEAVLERCPANEAGLNLADALIDAGQVERSAKLAEKIAAQNPGLEPQIAVLEIKRKVKSRQWKNAIQSAEAAFQRHGRDKVPAEALYWTAEAQIKTGQSAEAIQNFKEFVAWSPGSRLAPSAALMAGLLHLNLQRMEEAKADLEFTVKTYPKSPAAEKARKFLAISTRQGEPVLRDPKDTR